MMEAEESHPTTSSKKGATEAMATTEQTPKQPPPSIQLEHSNAKAEQPAEKRDADEKSFGQLRTPKHANKTSGAGGSGSRDESSPTTSGARGFSRDNDKKANMNPTPQQQQQQPNYPTQERGGQEYHGDGYQPYRGQLDPSAASYYAARVRMMRQAQQQQQAVAPQTVSPGGGTGMTAAAMYSASTGGYGSYSMQGGRYQQEGYRQGDYAGFPRGQGGGSFAPYHQDARYGGAYGDGSSRPQYGQGIPPSYSFGQQQQQQQRASHGHYDPRYAGPQQGNAMFSRAVSNSFDRSTKSSGDRSAPGMPPHGHGGNVERRTTVMEPAYYPQENTQHVGVDASVPDDHSWGALNQVASVDDSTLARARIAQQLERNQVQNDNAGAAKLTDEKEVRQPPSNSSSLTNSPVEGNEAAVKPQPSPSKMAPLDSLSSVASAQEPMDTTGSKDGKPKPGGGSSSPNSSQGSLDLMKCHSGSSGLLQSSFPAHATHDRTMSGSSFLLDHKRAREFGSGGAHPTPGEAGPPSKKAKSEDANKAKRDGKSPLSVECSPPKRGAPPQVQQLPPHMSLQERVNAATGRSSTSPAYMGYPNLEKAPSYTYSIDSVPSKEYGGYPALPARPGSSTSSTVAPGGGSAMQIDGHLPPTDAVNRDSLVGTLPSWDILHQQDSFGAGSVGAGGAPIVGNFSFSQDYPMLSASNSNLGLGSMNPAQAQANQQAGAHHGPPTSLAESRNQSFEGGHYHGGVPRSDSMELSYTGSTQNGARQYQMAPQAPSWGTASSSNSTQPTQPGASYQHAAQLAQYRNATGRLGGTMLRNYSEDNAARTSPPNSSGFQPPSDFVAPRHPQLRRPPPQAVYIMSSDGRKKNNDAALSAKSNAGGVYGWSKEEDNALTEVMKKFKNPRDWEPIAKEHGFNKSAKECHERWIRYLKPGVRKGQWTDHEDAIVVEAVSSSTEQPFTRWSDLAQKLPGRVGKQIRDRWVNHLNPNINHMPFSKEDDLLLWEGHKQLGKRWVEISTKFFNSSRSENHIKNRWYSASFKKFIANEYGPNAHSGGGKTNSGKKAKKALPKPDNTAEV